MSSSKGVPPSGSGHSASPEPVVSALRASVPNVARISDTIWQLGLVVAIVSAFVIFPLLALARG